MATCSIALFHVIVFCSNDGGDPEDDRVSKRHACGSPDDFFSSDSETEDDVDLSYADISPVLSPVKKQIQ